MVEPSDEELMRRTGNGDREAYAALVRRHLGRTTGLARRIAGSAADADEIAQEAFMRVWTKAPNWQGATGEGGGARFTTWLYRVTVNLCIDRRRRRRERPLEDAGDPPDPSPSAADGIAGGQLAARVSAAVAALPERQRTALALCFFEELSNREAAEIMALSPGAVESLLVRARRQLRAALAPAAAEFLEVSP
jgi:RNA polymerase sigma-70 factor (ECF subfamily)